jgi:hypothetical protein
MDLHQNGKASTESLSVMDLQGGFEIHPDWGLGMCIRHWVVDLRSNFEYVTCGFDSSLENPRGQR